MPIRGNWTITDFIATCNTLGVGVNRYDLNKVNPTTRARTSLTSTRPNLDNVYESAGILSSTSVLNGELLSVDVDSVTGAISDVTLAVYGTPA